MPGWEREHTRQMQMSWFGVYSVRLSSARPGAVDVALMRELVASGRTRSAAVSQRQGPQFCRQKAQAEALHYKISCRPLGATSRQGLW